MTWREKWLAIIGLAFWAGDGVWLVVSRQEASQVEACIQGVVSLTDEWMKWLLYFWNTSAGVF